MKTHSLLSASRTLSRPIQRIWSRNFSSPVLPLTVLSEEEQLFKETVAKFAQTNIKPFVSEMDEKKVMKPEVISDLFQNGFMGIEIPSKYNGSEASFTCCVVAIEELAKVDPSVSVCCDVQNTLVNNVFRFFASETLKAKYLPQLAVDKLGCFCLSENVSGSDAFALKTKAEKLNNGDFVLNGSKSWITNSGEADIFLVFANTDFSKGYKGITCFVAEKAFPGLQVQKREDKLGIRASSTCSITFDDVKIPKENILGEIGTGYKIAISILNEGRIGIGAQMVGLSQGTFDLTIPYLKERQQFGKSIGDFQGMQFQYAQLAVEIEAARLMVYNAARTKENKLDFVKQAAMAKLFASQVATKVTRTCVELMGGVGFTKEFPQEKFYRDSLIGSIYEGTSNIQLQTIAKLVQKDYW